MNANDASAQFKEAEKLFEANRVEDAMAILDKLDALYPNTGNLVYARARCLVAVNRFSEAGSLCLRLRDEFNDARATELLLQCAQAGKTALPESHTNQVESSKSSKGKRPTSALIAATSVLVAIAAVGGYFAFNFNSSQQDVSLSEVDAKLIGTKIPDFTFKDIRYLPRTLADFGNKK
ncbi:MAG: tetratricopeptide repeat protein, partial [Candidatus Hydrogenedentota bacterium]